MLLSMLMEFTLSRFLTLEKAFNMAAMLVVLGPLECLGGGGGCGASRA